MNESDLEALLDDVESDRVERKESLKGDAAEKAREAICAFANDLPNHRKPGFLFVGAKDDGTPAALHVTDALLQQLADMRSDGNILPLPTITIEKRILKGSEMAVMAVFPADAPPVRYRGRIWIRIGPRRAYTSAQEERILNEKRRKHDLPFDLRALSHATIEDLSRELFEGEYLATAIAPEVLAENNRSYEEQLAATRMIDSISNSFPTVLGCLVLSNRSRDLIPCDYIQFLRIDGTTLSDPIQDDELIDGPLVQMLRRLDDKLEAHIQIAVDIMLPRERRIPNYPLVALQQFARNAVMHRVYEHTNTPIRVTWYIDRIEISSFGGPYGMVTKQNFGKPGYTDYRNPHLAEAMRTLGFVQKFGVGIQAAQKALLVNGNPPAEFSVEENLILVRILGKI